MFRILRNRKGQGMMEYAILAAVLAVVAYVGVNAIKKPLDKKFTDTATEIAK